MAKSTARTKKTFRPLNRKGRATARSRGGDDRTVEIQFAEAVKRHLGKVQTLSEFLTTAGELGPSERLTIVEQALLMIDQTYVHLPLKRAMHAIDPVQRLRLVKQRLETYSERAFHDEMITIFLHLRDLHTNYVLPQPYRSRTAFLPFHIEEYFEPAAPNTTPVRRYVVTEVMSGLSDKDFKPGVVVTHWNGVPMDTAIEVNAEREAGSNLDARHLQGLQSITMRWMAMSLPPDEEWVVVRYLSNDGAGPAREARFDWQVFVPLNAPAGRATTVLGAERHAGDDANLRRIGIDAKSEMQRRVRKLLFAPDAVAAQQKMFELGERAHAAAQAFHVQAMAVAPATREAIAPELGSGSQPARSNSARRASAAAGAALSARTMIEGVDLAASSIMPDIIKQFGKVGPKGTFGYIRIVTFDMQDVTVESFIQEFIRIVALLPQGGLIVDVRGNGGGTIAAGEGLLQTMTPRTIEPERFHLINTPLTQQMCENDAELDRWKASVKEAVETGSTFSQGIPLTDLDFCNSIGQIYQGPVVLIVDAGCYSTTDMFAAGFQDHEIGVILGVSGHTGAGGANVWEHTDLEQSLPGPFVPLPGEASFRVAIRRSTRVGERSGQPLEDLGVVPPPPIYRMTRNDVLNHNEDLIARGCEILAGMPRQRLAATSGKRADGSLDVTVTTSNLSRVDVYLNRRPLRSLDVKDGSVSFNVVGSSVPSSSVLECQGFRGEDLVASTRVQL